MLRIDEARLNRNERATLDALATYTRDNPPPTIVEAADICRCSPSHVSKAVRKAGFAGYKQYVRYLSLKGSSDARTADDTPVDEAPVVGPATSNPALGEVARLKQFLDEFDPTLVEEVAGLIGTCKKIVLFGYGPSMICAQYVEYKLRFCVQSFVATAPDEQSVRSMVDGETLLIIVTTTGRFRSFEVLVRDARAHSAQVVIVSEELNPDLAHLGGRYIALATRNQPDTLEPHEKTRTTFFIFFEQVVQHILHERKHGRSETDDR